LAKPLLGALQLVGVSLRGRVESQRIGRRNLTLIFAKALRVEQQLDPSCRAQPKMVIALIANLVLIVKLAPIEHLAAAWTLAPYAVWNRLLSRRGHEMRPVCRRKILHNNLLAALHTRIQTYRRALQHEHSRIL
jgi:hypothetical protein